MPVPLQKSLQDLLKSVFDGRNAITVQPYTEVNSKTGSQFELAFFAGTVANGATSSIAIETGPNPLAVKGILTQFNEDSIQSQLFKGGTFTGGSVIPSYALRDSLGTSSDTVFTGGITVADTGTAIGPLVTSLGSSGLLGSTVSSTGLDIGVERILEENSTYIYRLTNNSGSAQEISGVVTWYEGGLDL